MVESVQISEQDRHLLDLIATCESGAFGYTAYYPSSNNPALIDMTLQQVLNFQANRTGVDRVASSACGRYQFVQGTLETAINITGLDRNRVRFTPIIQDYLILAILRRYRKMDSWKSGSLSSADFQLQLAAEFASIPVPYAVPARSFTSRIPRRDLLAGESLYAGDGLNAAGHKAATFTANLEDIRNGGAGQVQTVDVETTGGSSPVAASSPEGNSFRRVAETAVTGGQRISGGRRTMMAPNHRVTLAEPGNVYLYEDIHPFDDRYDFRVGKKVIDLAVNGSAPVSANPFYTPQADPLNYSTQSSGVSQGRDSTGANGQPVTYEVGFGIGQVDPALARAAGLTASTTSIAPGSIGYGLSQVDPALARAANYIPAPTASTVPAGVGRVTNTQSVPSANRPVTQRQTTSLSVSPGGVIGPQ